MAKQNFMPYEKLSNSPTYSAMPLEVKLAECTKQLDLAVDFASRLSFRVTETRKNPGSIDVIFEDNLGGLTTDWIKDGVNIALRVVQPHLPYNPNRISEELVVVDGVLIHKSFYRYWVEEGEFGYYSGEKKKEEFRGVSISPYQIPNTKIHLNGEVYRLSLGSEGISAIVQGKVYRHKWTDYGSFPEPVRELNEAAIIIISDLKRVFICYLEDTGVSYEFAIRDLQDKTRQEVERIKQQKIQEADFTRASLDDLKLKNI